MTRVPMYQVDAFTDRPFRGNPAAVCPLADWLPDAEMQAIAAENNLSETAFLVGDDGDYSLRWFTPLSEVNLCGHATLASAFVLFERMGVAGDVVRFDTRSGRLSVRRGEDGLLRMDFPSIATAACEPEPDLVEGLGGRPPVVMRSVDPAADYHLAVYDAEADVAALSPDPRALGRLDSIGVIATAAGTEVDFVSRFFAPRVGIPEDPVTGSAHSILAPYWAERLGRSRLTARQISPRGGELWCRVGDDRVEIAGRAVLVMEGTLAV